MIKRIFNSQTKSITIGASLMLFSGIASKLLALVRDRLLAGKFGAGEDLDVYFTAFRVPDLVYGILILGGVATVFLPVFSEYFRKDENEGWKLASGVLNSFLILLVVICGILAFFAPDIVGIIAPGFSAAQKEATVDLTRIMFLSPIFFGLSSVFSGVLHYFNRFFAYSLAPVFYNLGIILGIVFFVPFFGLKGLAFGVVIGAVFHWLIQVPVARNSGFKHSAVFGFKHPGCRKIFKLMLPRTVGTAAYHLNLIVVTAIASTLVAGSIAIFNFSNNLQYLPVGLFGISFAVASFPVLSRNWAEGDGKVFLDNFFSSFSQLIFLVVPVSFLIFLLRAQIVRLVLGTGEFGWQDTRLTAASLGLFSLGILAASLVPLLARTFYSFQDTRTPVLIGVATVIINIALSFLFVSLLQEPGVFQESVRSILKIKDINNVAVVGLPLALSISGIFQFLALLAFLKRKLKDVHMRGILKSFNRAFFASLLMAVSIYFSLRVAASFVDMQTFFGVLAQTAFAALVGLLAYFLAARILKFPELELIKGAVVKEFKRDMN